MEALNLDIVSGDAKIKFSRDFVTILEEMGFDGTENLETID